MVERLVIDDITHWARTYKVIWHFPCASLLYLALDIASSILYGTLSFQDNSCKLHKCMHRWMGFALTSWAT